MLLNDYLACLFQVVFVRKLLVLVVSIWFPPVTSMITRALSLAFIVLLSLVPCTVPSSMSHPLTSAFPIDALVTFASMQSACLLRD